MKFDLKFPITLQSPEIPGQPAFFRRIHEDGRVEKKLLGGAWEPNDTPTLVMPIDKYLYHLKVRMKWKML